MKRYVLEKKIDGSEYINISEDYVVKNATPYYPYVIAARW